jgi:hypothetical protein
MKKKQKIKKQKIPVIELWLVAEDSSLQECISLAIFNLAHFKKEYYRDENFYLSSAAECLAVAYQKSESLASALDFKPSREEIAALKKSLKIGIKLKKYAKEFGLIKE